MKEEKPKLKIVYYVTLLIKYTNITPILNTNTKKRTEGLTVISEICKSAKFGMEAIDTIINKTNKTYPLMTVLAKSVTELTEDIFIDNVEEEIKEEGDDNIEFDNFGKPKLKKV